MPNDNRKWLYDKLTEKGVNLGSYEQFDNAFSDDKNAQWFYDKAKEKGLNLGTYEQYIGAMRPNTPAKTEKDAEKPAQPATPAPQETPKPVEQPAQAAAPTFNAPTVTLGGKEVKTEKSEKPTNPSSTPLTFQELLASRRADVSTYDQSPQAVAEKAGKEAEKAYQEHLKAERERYAAGRENDTNLYLEPSDELILDNAAKGKGYSLDSAVETGKAYEQLLADRNTLQSKQEEFAKKWEKNIAGDKFSGSQAQFAQYKKEFEAIDAAMKDVNGRQEAIMATPAGKELQAIMTQADALAKNEDTPENRWARVQNMVAINRNPLYRAAQGGNAPSASELDFTLNRGEADYLEAQMEDADKKKKKELKSRLKELQHSVLDNDFYRADVAKRIEEARQAKADIVKRMTEIRTQTLKEKSKLETLDDALLANPEYQNLRLALVQREQAERKLGHILDKNADDFWVNVLDVFTDPNTYNWNITNLETGLAARIAMMNPEAAGAEDLLASVAVGNAVSEEEGKYVEGKGKYGQIAANSIPFMFQIGLTGGFSGIAKGVERGVIKGISNAVGRDLGNNFFVKATGVALGDIAAGVVSANTTGAAKTFSDFNNRYFGTLVSDGNGGYQYVGGDGLVRSLWKSEAGNSIEFISERFGDHVQRLIGRAVLTSGRGFVTSDVAGQVLREGGKNISRTRETLAGMMGTELKEFGLRSANKLDANWMEKAMNGFFKAMDKMGIQGFPFEVMEEYVGQLENILVGGEEEWMDFSSFEDKEFHTDIWGGMLYSIGFSQAGALAMGGVGSAISGIERAKAFHMLQNQLEATSNAARQMIGNEQDWNFIKKKVDETSNKDLPALINTYLQAGGLNDQQKRAFLDYLKATYIYRGFNAGTIAQARDRIVNPSNLQSVNVDAEIASAQDQLSDAFMLGYQMSTAKREDVEQADLDANTKRTTLEAIEQREELEKAIENQKKRLAGLVGEGNVSKEKANALLSSTTATQEQKDAALDYLMALSAEEGFDAAEQDKQIRIKAQLIADAEKGMGGKFYYEDEMTGESIVETTFRMGADGRPELVYITSPIPNSSGELSYRTNKGETGFITRDKVFGMQDGQVVPGMTATSNLNEVADTMYTTYVAQQEERIKQQDEQKQAEREQKEAATAETEKQKNERLVKEAAAAIRKTIEDYIAAHEGVLTIDGVEGTLRNVSDTGATFVPNDDTMPSVPNLSWNDIAKRSSGIFEEVKPEPAEGSGAAPASGPAPASTEIKSTRDYYKPGSSRADIDRMLEDLYGNEDLLEEEVDEELIGEYNRAKKARDDAQKALDDANPEKIEKQPGETLQGVAERRKTARENFEKVRGELEQKLKDAEDELTFWAEAKKVADANIKEREEEAEREKRHQADIEKYGVDTSTLHDLDTPLTLEEAVAQYLGNSTHLINAADAEKEWLGKGNTSAGEIFRHRGQHGILTLNGGQTVKAVAEDIVGEYEDLNLDEQKVFDEILNQLNTHTKTEMRDVIFQNRLKEAIAVKDAVENAPAVPAENAVEEAPQGTEVPEAEVPESVPAEPEAPTAEEERDREEDISEESIKKLWDDKDNYPYSSDVTDLFDALYEALQTIDNPNVSKEYAKNKRTYLIETARKHEGHPLADAILASVTTLQPAVEQQIKQARQEVDTNPTDAQKEAGNYKKGHIQIDGYDVTIENPKGSVRSGKDADGNEWSVTMNNDYGYIRGTEGVDGDHIDMFLSDHPGEGKVFVVDQVNEDGSFDEHKVMYGFNSIDEAREAYLANYSPGWKGLGAITEVSKEEFKKWIDSSHRKTKPFAEYKSVKAEETQSETPENKPQSGRNSGGKSVTSQGEKGNETGAPATAKDIKTKEQAQAYFEGLYGKGKRADNSVRVWELTHKKKSSPKQDEDGMVSQMAMSLANDTGLSDEEAAELVTLGTQLAEDYITEDGLVRFPQFFKNLVETFGDGIRPFAKSIYLGASATVSDELADKMDDRKAVRAFDENIDLNDISDEQEPISDVQQEPGGVSGTVADTPGEGVQGEPDNGTDTGASAEDSGSGETPVGELDGGNDSVADSGSGEPGANGTSGRGGRGRRKANDGGSTGKSTGRNRGAGQRENGSDTGVGRNSDGGESTGHGPVEETEAEKEAKATAKEQEAYESEKERIKDETDTKALKSLKDELKDKLQGLTDKFDLARAEVAGKLRAVLEKLQQLFSTNVNKSEALAQEKVPYVSVSDPTGEHSIGSVVPSGVADYMRDAVKRLEDEVGKSVAEYVQEELGYSSLEEMYSNLPAGKSSGVAAEQVDAIGLAIHQMKTGRMFIVGDMTGVGKGRVGAALIRWAKKQGKKVIFCTEKSNLFSAMYNDITDIGGLYQDGKANTTPVPWIMNSDSEANITDDEENILVAHPSDNEANALYSSGKDTLPVCPGGRNRGNIKGKQYDFVMTTYSQLQASEEEEEGDSEKVKELRERNKKGRQRLAWLKEYAKDAIVIMDESHTAASEGSTRGENAKKLVDVAGGVTFMSATFAKTPQAMGLYAIRSSMNDAMITRDQLIAAISRYGIPMQEILAAALFKTGEMVRRERDFDGVKTNWLQPEQVYTPEEIQTTQSLSDKTVEVINAIIDFQRRYVEPIVDKLNKDVRAKNEAAADAAFMSGAEDYYTEEYDTTPYSGQVSNVVGMMLFAIKAKKAAEVAIEQIKRGEKPVIAVDNTLGAYVDQIEGNIDSADFGAVLAKGLAFAMRYQKNTTHWKKTTLPNGMVVYKKVPRDRQVEKYETIESRFGEEARDAMEALAERITDYGKETLAMDLPLSPIDYIKKKIADAGYRCGEITKRANALVQNEDGTWKKEALKQEKKKVVINKFNGGKADKPLPKADTYDAVIMNRSGATGNSMHASARFGDQRPRKMIILQAAKDPNNEVQIRGRIDRTGQVRRGEYFYVISPIPAEKKITMMLKQKLASLDATSVGTENVSSNKVDAEDMDNKYGDEVARDFLVDHEEIHFQMDPAKQMKRDRKTGEYKGRPGLLYDLLLSMQRMTCAEQELILSELEEAYTQKIEYLNQNGINDLATTTMNLEATTIDSAIMVKGKDNDALSEFAHDTTIERVEVNVLRKPLRSEDIKKKSRELGAEEKHTKQNSHGETEDVSYGEFIQQNARDAVEKLKEEKKQKQAEVEERLLNDLRAQNPKREDETDEQYDSRIKNDPKFAALQLKNANEYSRYEMQLAEQLRMMAQATNYFKPGYPYLIPLNESENAQNMYGRFIGFKAGKDGRPKSVEAVFATKDSRAQVSIPVVNMNSIIQTIRSNSGGMYDIFGKTGYDYESEEARIKTYDDWWDKMIPKNTSRSIRYMITGNILQAAGSLFAYRGTITTFTRKDAETGEITVDKGLLLAEDFDPENFMVRTAITKDDVWNNAGEFTDDLTNIAVHRDGNNMIVKFTKPSGSKAKLINHPVMSDDGFKALCEGGEIEPYSQNELRAVVSEKNVEAALEYLYKNYGLTQGHLLVMPDSTDKPDRITYTGKPYNEVIESLKPKYRVYSSDDAQQKIDNELKTYRMDIYNEDVKTRIRELVQLRQAYIRRDYAMLDDSDLAWQVIIQEGEIERLSKSVPNETPEQALERKKARENARNRMEAYKEELESRGFKKGHLKHFKQGKVDLDTIEKTFNEFNSDKENARIAKKVFAIMKKLNVNFFMDEKAQHQVGGQTAGDYLAYNWRFMNEDWIPDQLKANTILHEMVHTATVYAIRAIENGADHLIPGVVDAANQARALFSAIRNNQAFRHQIGEDSWNYYKDYGTTNAKEMLAETGANQTFRDNLAKVKVLVQQQASFGQMMFTFSDVTSTPDAPGNVMTGLQAAMDILERMLDNFNADGYRKMWQGTGYGDMTYRRATENLRAPIDRARAIVEAQNLAKSLGIKFKEDPALTEKGSFDPKTGQIRINIDNHSSSADLQATIIHEAVGHYGLRKLLGKDFTSQMKEIYDNCAPSIKAEIDRIAKEEGYDTVGAVEEYLSQLAEDGRFTPEEESFWQRVWYAVQQMLRKLGWKGNLTEADMRALLYASHRNLQTRGAVAQAHHISVYNALRKQADISHLESDNDGPEDDGPGGGSRRPYKGKSISQNEENNVPLQWQDNELPANDFYDARGERHDGLNTILRKAQEELESLDKESDAANQIVQRIAAIQQELSARSAKQQEWKEKYHISDDGRISLEDLSVMYKDYNADEDLAELFEKVKSVAKQIGLDIKFKDTLDNSGVSEYNGRISFHLDFLTASGTPDFGVSATILHELIHSVTQSTTYAYRKGGKLADSLTKSQKKAVQELNAVFDELFEQTLWEDVPYWAEQGLQDADEMMAELANPAFRMFLMDVPTASGNKNFLQRIVDAIKRLFGFGANNMFDKAERALDRMLNNFSMDTFETVRQPIDDIDWDSYADDFGLTDDGINDLPEELREEAIRQNTKALYRSRAKLANAAQTYAQVGNGKDVLYEVLVDEYAPVDTFSDAMVQDSKIDIKDSERVSDAFREIGGKAEKAIKDFNHKFLEPLWDAVGRFRATANIKAGEFVNYIGLKSGLERNVVFAARDARHDYQTEYSAVENDANKEIRRINIDEKKKLERLQKQLDEGKISDVAYSNGVVRVQLEAKTLRQKQQDDIDAAKAVLDAHLKDIKAGIDPRFLEYRKKDYSAIMAWAGTDNLEDAEDLARDYVNDIESRAGSDVVDDLWDKMNAATKETLRFQYEHDMLTKQQYDDVRTMMQYYVPMRGFEEDTAEDLYNYYVSAQKQTFQPTIPTAKGRKTLFESPLGYIGAMHASAVAQGLKNQAKLSLLNLVRNRKGSNLASITRAWFVNTHVKDASGRYIYEVRYPDIPEGTDRDTREKIIKDFEDEMKDLRMNGDAYNSHREVDLHGGVVAFEKDSHKNEHMVKVREGGREFGIIINGNPAAAQAINGVRRGGGYGSFLDAAHTFTRALSQMFTTFSIPFWVSNFQRDFGQGVTNNFVRNKGEYLGKYFKNYAKAFKVFYLAMGSDKIDKSIAGGSEIAKLYKEYLENGGPMGQNRVENNEYYERQMKRYLKNAGKKGVIAAGRDVLEFVGAVGEAVETITRFATFMTSREMGRPIHEAISDAKEVSTNFARKGSGRALTRDEVSRLTRANGTKLNKAEQNALLTISWGVEFFRATIPFFNAAVQGLENKGTNYREHFAKTLISDVTYFVLGFGMRMLLGAMGGDDDKEKYSHTSDYLRRNNILTPLGNGWYSKWALPQEYRVCYALGDILASAMSQDRPLDDLGIDALGSILQLSPVGAVTDEVLFSGGDVQQAGWNLLIGLMPGVVDPILESLLNRDFKGSRLYNEGFNDNLRKYPGWTKAIDSTGEAYTAVAEQMNKLHIGKDDEGKWGVWIADDVQNRVLRGTFNINPAIVEHLVESYFSGPYQVVKLGAAGVKAVTKGGVKTRDIPFWNRFVLNTNDNDRDAYYSNMYYYFKEISTETERIFSEYKKAGSTEHMKDLSKNKDYQYMLAFKMADAQEKALRKQGKLAEQKGDLELKKQAEAKLQKLHEDIAKRCLDIYFDREAVK